MVEGIPPIKTSNGACIGCVVGKHLEHSYEKEKARIYTQVLGSVHSYITRPLPTPCYGGPRYVLTFIDDFSRFYWVYFLKLKSELTIPMQMPIFIQSTWRLGFTFRSACLASYLIISYLLFIYNNPKGLF